MFENVIMHETLLFLKRLEPLMFLISTISLVWIAINFKKNKRN